MSGNTEPTLYRYRIAYTQGVPIRYIGHLDMMRAWERVLRRAAIPLAYSQGFNPHPRLTMAMPLPVGCTSEAEELDVILSEALSESDLLARLRLTLPPGLSVRAVTSVPLRDPARPSRIASVEYAVTLSEVTESEVFNRVTGLLASDHLEVEFRRKQFDLRPLISMLTVQAQDDLVLHMHLLRDAKGRIGRPDVVLAALDLVPFSHSIHRLHIHFAPPK